MGDGALTWPVLKAVQYQSEIGKSNVYFSFFAYEGTFSNTFVVGAQTYYGMYVIK